MSANVTTLPVTQRRWRWPNYPLGLYEDHEGFHHDAEHLDRTELDRCIRAVGPDNAPGLLCDFAGDGVLDLARPDMSGVVAAVWAASAHAPSAMAVSLWLSLFHGDGFSINGHRANRPLEPVRVFRGCVPLVRYFGSDMRLVDTDDRGCPLDPADVVEVRDTRLDLAWTSSLLAARRHARHCLPLRRGQVFAATVAPKYLLAIIGADYVVDPAGLTDVAPVGLGIAAVSR